MLYVKFQGIQIVNVEFYHVSIFKFLLHLKYIRLLWSFGAVSDFLHYSNDNNNQMYYFVDMFLYKEGFGTLPIWFHYPNDHIISHYIKWLPLF
jgi:hypothetical protein